MTNVTVYSEQPVLAAGLQASLAAEGTFAASLVCTDLRQLTELLRSQSPTVLLVELTPQITVGVLADLLAQARSAPVVLWVDAISTEFASQAIGLGIRGILRKDLPVELQVKSLQKVAAGELWIEQELSGKVLLAKRVTLSPRERQVTGLVAQGLKNKEIAHLLKLTEGTIKVYLAKLTQKVGASDRFDLALLAWKNCFPIPASAPSQRDAGRPVTLGLPEDPSFLPSYMCIRHAGAAAL